MRGCLPCFLCLGLCYTLLFKSGGPISPCLLGLGLSSLLLSLRRFPGLVCFLLLTPSLLRCLFGFLLLAPSLLGRLFGFLLHPLGLGFGGFRLNPRLIGFRASLSLCVGVCTGLEGVFFRLLFYRHYPRFFGGLDGVTRRCSY